MKIKKSNKWHTVRAGKGGHQFKVGNPGRPKGSKDRLMVLRDAIVESAMAIMAHMPNERTKAKKEIQKKLIEMAIHPTDLMKIAASFVPRKLKLEKTTASFIGIEVRKMGTEELNQALISRLTQRGVQAVLPTEEDHSD